MKIKMPNKLIRASVSLRSAKLRLEEAEQLIAASGGVDAKIDIDKALSYIEGLIANLDRQGATNPGT